MTFVCVCVGGGGEGRGGVEALVSKRIIFSH